MRFLRWRKQFPEYTPEEYPKKRQRETLTSLSERLILREMKRNPEYGLKVAEKVKSISKDETSMTAQLRQFKELRNLLKDVASVDGGSSSMIRDILQCLPQVIATLPQAMETMRQQQGNAGQLPVQQSVPVQIQQPEPQPEPVQQPQVYLYQLHEVLEMPPEQAFEILQTSYPDWVRILAMLKPEQVMAQVMSLATDNPEVTPIIEQLSSETGREWLNKIIKLAKANTNQ